MSARNVCIITPAFIFFPCKSRYKTSSPKHLITQYLQIMTLIVVNRNPQRTVVRQQAPYDFQPIPHQPQPDRMLQPVVVMGKGTAGVIRWIDKHAFHLAAKLLLQRLQRQQVIAENQPVVENIVI